MAASADNKDRPPRFMSRDARRQQLIEATIDTLAQRGFSRTTLTEVARTAGLSHGLVLFHFETKEKLLAETLAHLAEEYRANWTAALAAAGPEPAHQLNALIEADFDLKVFTPARLAAWCAFWGEAQSRPLYQASCGEKDEDYNRTMEEICQRLIDEGGYSGSAVRLARIVRVTIEGVWLDRMTMAAPYSPDEALATVRLCAARCFPAHFSDTGPR
ncbi:MAG: TetR/AcrR family transcriptional regulator [Rhodobacteraceae bacterium]|nr:TetR/AcrR family transcriptional regulator [Paracoccaceae bacterium]